MSLSLIFSYLALFHCKFLHFSFSFFSFVFIKGSAPHGTPCPVRTDPFGVCLSIFCLFPCICIHFELVDVPNKAVKKKKIIESKVLH